MLTHIYGHYKNGTEKSSRERTCGHSKGQIEKVALTYIHYYVGSC